VESVTYGVESLEDGIRFFEDWGLRCVARGRQGADFELPGGQSLHLRSADDSGLPAAVEGGSAVREVIWGVDSERSLEEVGAELARDREVTRDATGLLRTRDPSGIPIGFRVVSRGVTSARPSGASPVSSHRIAHVVFSVTRSKAPEMAEFYLDRLRFRLSDRVRDNGDFIRAAGADDHHNFFIQHRPDRLAFNHVAFELDSYDRVLLGGKYMEARGWKTALGPGSHYLSSHQFWYFKSPCGGDAEYFFGAKRFDDSWTSRVWDTAPRTGPSGA
jgi:hypothetical protein